jgi:hypothetical protein
MIDLSDFLLARIAEDANYAEHAKWAMQGEWFTMADDKVDEFVRHMAPARVLAEVEAKRRIVEAHVAGPTGWHEDDGEPVRYCHHCHRESPCLTLRALAALYADHPDYCEAWRP